MCNVSSRFGRAHLDTDLAASRSLHQLRGRWHWAPESAAPPGPMDGGASCKRHGRDRIRTYHLLLRRRPRITRHHSPTLILNDLRKGPTRQHPPEPTRVATISATIPATLTSARELTPWARRHSNARPLAPAASHELDRVHGGGTGRGPEKRFQCSAARCRTRIPCYDIWRVPSRTSG